MRLQQHPQAPLRPLQPVCEGWGTLVAAAGLLLLKNPSVEIRDISRGKCCILPEKRSETVESRTDQHLTTNIHPMRGRPTKEEPLLEVAVLE